VIEMGGGQHHLGGPDGGEIAIENKRPSQTWGAMRRV
jgi:hypothetical protein